MPATLTCQGRPPQPLHKADLTPTDPATLRQKEDQGIIGLPIHRSRPQPDQHHPLSHDDQGIGAAAGLDPMREQALIPGLKRVVFRHRIQA